MAMPVHVINGAEDGTVLFVSAAIHGDELNGVEIIRRIIKLAALRRLQGSADRRSNRERARLSESQSVPSGPARPQPLIPRMPPKARWPPASPKCSWTRSFRTPPTASISTPALCTGRTFRKSASIWTIPRPSPWRARSAPAGGEFRVPRWKPARGGRQARRARDRLRGRRSAALRRNGHSDRPVGRNRSHGAPRHVAQAKRGRESIAPVILRDSNWVRAPASGVIRMRQPIGAEVEDGALLAVVSDPLARPKPKSSHRWTA